MDVSEGREVAESKHVKNCFATAFQNENPLELWHKRLGHLGHKIMSVLEKLADGMNLGKYNQFEQCVACIEGKQCRKPFPVSSPRLEKTSKVLELIHSDLCGPMDPLSIHGDRYFLTFIDDFTRKTFICFLKSKDSVCEAFKIFRMRVENETNEKIKCLRTDNGSEYVNDAMLNELKKWGIRHETTIPYSPEQNGLAERANRTIVEKARCMLQGANLPKGLWVEACRASVYLKNRSPTKALINALPEEKWSGKRVDLSHLKVFGCVAYEHVPKQFRKKFDPTSKRHYFVGYCEESKGYLLVDPDKAYRVKKARNVVFFENVFRSPKETETRVASNDVLMPLSTSVVEHRGAGIDVVLPQPNESDGVDSSTSSEGQGECETANVGFGSSEGNSGLEGVRDVGALRKSQRVIKPTQYTDFILYLTTMGGESCDPVNSCMDPQTVGEALSRNRDEWLEAMEDEWNALVQKGVFELVDLPKGKSTVNCKWVFREKKNENVEIVRYRARLVAKGCSQKYGEDYKETFSPVVSYSTVRVLIALAVELNLQIRHFDVTAAFLNGELKETIYMKQPEGFVKPGAENKVCLLKRAIYGLKQASKSWYDKCKRVLTDVGFKNFLTEPCVYVKGNDDSLCILAVYVDDFLVFGQSNVATNLLNALKKYFELRDLGEAKNVLGMRIKRNGDEISIDQKEYVKGMLTRFKMLDCDPIATPVEVNLNNLLKGDPEKLPRVPYQMLIGSLMYAMVCTRPDIAFTVGKLSRYNNCYTMEHWEYAKRVLRYLKATIDYGIVYNGSGKSIEGFVDARKFLVLVV